MTLTLDLELPTQRDVALLVDHLDAYLSTLYPPTLRHVLTVDALAQPETIFCVARLDGQAVGCGGAVPRGAYVEIKRMYVEPAARRQGIARRILQHLENEVARRGHTCVRLETGMYNDDAMALYESSGYALIPQFDNYVGSPISVCYEKRLALVAA